MQRGGTRRAQRATRSGRRSSGLALRRLPAPCRLARLFVVWPVAVLAGGVAVPGSTARTLAQPLAGGGRLPAGGAHPSCTLRWCCRRSRLLLLLLLLGSGCRAALPRIASASCATARGLLAGGARCRRRGPRIYYCGHSCRVGGGSYSRHPRFAAADRPVDAPGGQRCCLCPQGLHVAPSRAVCCRCEQRLEALTASCCRRAASSAAGWAASGGRRAA